MDELERLTGVITSVIYVNPDNGYTVLEISNETDTVPAVGILPDVNPGEQVSVLGKWVLHKDYGRQFQIQSIEIKVPETTAQIQKYLASGAVPGVGPVLAERIIEAFGDEALKIIENDYFRLAEVKGISVSKAEEISRAYSEQFGLRTAMLFLQQFDISPAECIRIYKKYGLLTHDVIKNDPYVLSTRMHMPFARVDAIAEQLGFDQTSQKRICAGVLYVMYHNCLNGHTFIPLKKIAPVACKMLGCEPDDVSEAIQRLIDGEELYLEDIEDTECLFLPECYKAESYIAQRLCLINRSIPSNHVDQDKLINRLEKQLGIEYDVKQRDAVEQAMQRGLLVLTGGPGTGKTTIIRGILEGFCSIGLNACLAAPTGLAAKRMTELTGFEAKTVHRLLEASFDDNGKSRFSRDEQNPLDYEAVILDEASMVDVFTFESLLRAMKLGCRLVIVGDADQLPSVGPGNVLRDIIDSGLLPCIKLDRIFRQAAESLMITNSHHVVNGEMPVLNRSDSDFFFIPSENELSASDTVCDLVSRRLPSAYGFDPVWDIQVVCPSKKGVTGTAALNKSLQAVLNPQSGSKDEVMLRGTVFRVGDKIMQIRNNYDLLWVDKNGEHGAGIYNGDIGVVEKIIPSATELKIRVEDKLYDYPFSLADDLDLAYAITVHKSQGSEFDAVVLPVGSVPEKLVYRNLFYTAITRAKKMIVLIGSKNTVSAMVANVNKNARYTALTEFIYREN